MIENVKKNAIQRMQKSVQALQQELAKLRTGRAHPSLLEHIRVDYYGNETPLNQIASITAADARTLSITPWEKTMIPTIEKAIMTSGLGLNPVTAGTIIRVPLPALTEERRKDFVRLVRNEGENGRVAIRNTRRDANNELKELLKSKKITEDDERRGQDDIQKLTDKYIAEAESLIKAKEAELMEV